MGCACNGKAKEYTIESTASHADFILNFIFGIVVGIIMGMTTCECVASDIRNIRTALSPNGFG